MDIDWDMVIISVLARWILFLTIKPKVKRTSQKTFYYRVLHTVHWTVGWVDAVHDKLKWKAMVAELLGFPFLQISMQCGLKECSAGRDLESQWLNWLLWAQSLKNWYKCYNLCHWWGCIWEPLCLFLHLLVKLCLGTFHPNWELRSSFSDSVHFKEACNLSSF